MAHPSEIPVDQRQTWARRQRRARGEPVEDATPKPSYPTETLAEATGQVFGAPKCVILSTGQRVFFTAPKMGKLKELIAYAASMSDSLTDAAGIAKFTEHMMLHCCIEFPYGITIHPSNRQAWFDGLDGNDGILLIECMAELVDLQALMQKATNLSGKARGLRPAPKAP
jgi:hypothetical protein